ncbi:hypothetical protein CBS101457_005732 [Exobasidium rhododendri]|nr:hypothetical protein CBS101457_005732 [Exobasidium rhododendri]
MHQVCTRREINLGPLPPAAVSTTVSTTVSSAKLPISVSDPSHRRSTSLSLSVETRLQATPDVVEVVREPTYQERQRMTTIARRKIAVLGSRSVGKSTLIVRYMENVFVDSYYPTIEATFTKTIKHKGKEYNCDIIDTAGQDEYSILNSKHAIGIHGYVLVYSIASRTSFEMIQTVYDKILNYMGTESVPCVIVGQKNDLHVQRQVSEEEGKELASQLKCAWVETSARHDVNIDKVFDLILGETERDTVEGGPEPPASKCTVM